MPSSYCRSNPSAFQCTLNPNYQPLGSGSGNSNSGNFSLNLPAYTPAYNPSIPDFSQYDFSSTAGYNPNYKPSPVYNPNVSIQSSGAATVNITPLDKILSTITSMTALFKRAPYVPTTSQPDAIAVDPNEIILRLAQERAGLGNTPAGANTLGKVEAWLKNNTGVAIMGAAAVALFFMKPPTKTR